MSDRSRESAAVSDAAAHHKTRRAEEYSGLAILVLCLAVGVLMLAAGPTPYIGTWPWAGLLLGCLTATFFAASGLLSRRGQLAAYAAAVLSSWALLLTMSNQGMLVVVLIVVAAVGTYIVPMRLVVGVALLNCLVIAVHLWAHGEPPLEYTAAALFYLILHIAAALSTYALWREIQLRAELEQKNVELKAAGVLLEGSAAAAERLRISRELHDLIGHQLTVLNLELEAAKHRQGSAAREHVERAGTVAKDLLADVRVTVGELREASPGDLQQVLQRLADAVPSLEIHVEVDDGLVVDEDIFAALIRASQEIITNTIKHSEAAKLTLNVCVEKDLVLLTGTNDGLTSRTFTPGQGLTGLRERIELLDGSLEVRPRQVFTVEVRLPLRRAVKAAG